MNTIRYGYKIEFSSPPPKGGLLKSTPVPPSLAQRQALESEIQDLLAKEAIYIVPRNQSKRLYRSSFFLTPKKGNLWRPILNLKPLNKRFIRPKRFRMETLATIIPLLSPGLWATSIDLKDAYLHVPVHPLFHRYLAFRYKGTDYCFKAMPFGLSTAPRVFTRITRVILAYLRSKGRTIFAYLDDWLLLANSKEESIQFTSEVVSLLSSLGWVINHQKSALIPAQRVTYLGADLDLEKGFAFPSETRIDSIVSLASQISRQHPLRARIWLCFLGHLASLVEVLPLCRLRMRPLQLHVLRHFKPSQDPLSKKIPHNPKLSKDLQWWSDPSNLKSGRCFREIRPLSSMFTDASQSGWGAVLGALALEGQWNEHEKNLHINVLELRAVVNAVSHWKSVLAGHLLTVFTDNSTTMAYINRQGGTRSPHLCQETLTLFSICQSINLEVKASHLAGTTNTMADALSRGTLDHNEWELSQVWADPFSTCLVDRP